MEKLNSRADYFRQRRMKRKAFYVELDREFMERFEKQLIKQNKTKVEWLIEKIGEELAK